MINSLIIFIKSKGRIGSKKTPKLIDLFILYIQLMAIVENRFFNKF